MKLRECLLQASARGLKTYMFKRDSVSRESKRILDIIETKEVKTDRGKWECKRNFNNETVVVLIGSPHTYYHCI